MTPARSAVLLGGLIVLGAWPAAAQSTPPAAAPATVASNDASPAREAYLEKARADLRGWRQELDAFDARVAADGHADGREVAGRLHVAWANTEAEAGRLETAGAEGWDRAKASFEEASRGLSRALEKVIPGRDAAPAN